MRGQTRRFFGIGLIKIYLIGSIVPVSKIAKIATSLHPTTPYSMYSVYPPRPPSARMTSVPLIAPGFISELSPPQSAIFGCCWLGGMTRQISSGF